eukprot:EG_transcript_7471
MGCASSCATILSCPHAPRRRGCPIDPRAVYSTSGEDVSAISDEEGSSSGGSGDEGGRLLRGGLTASQVFARPPTFGDTVTLKGPADAQRQAQRGTTLTFRVKGPRADRARPQPLVYRLANPTTVSEPFSQAQRPIRTSSRQHLPPLAPKPTPGAPRPHVPPLDGDSPSNQRGCGPESPPAVSRTPRCLQTWLLPQQVVAEPLPT